MSDLDAFIARISPEYVSLDQYTRKSVHEFFILWSLFESRQLHCRATMSKLEKVSEDIELSRVDIAQLEDLFSFFLDRYTTGGKPNSRFKKLRFPKRSKVERECVERSFATPCDDPRKALRTCLYIVYRVRNNLFHGTKWTGSITDHDQLFCRINALLRMLLVAGMHNPSALS